MKINRCNLMVILLALLFVACKKDDKFFEGEEGIYFSVQYGPEWGDEKVWANQAITEVEFVNVLGDSDTLELKVMTTGNIKDFDRPFSIEVLKDSTDAVQGENYEPLETSYVIKAGEYYTMIPLVLKRAENIKEGKKSLTLRLLPNEHFTIGIPVWQRLPNQWESQVFKGDFPADQHRIMISDFVTRPSEWIGLDNDGLEAGMWGAFTEKKYRLIAEHFDLVYDDFMSPTSMPSAKKTVIREYMVRYLQNLYNQGTPILEDDGRLMWFMGVSWTSRIGVPWNGQ